MNVYDIPTKHCGTKKQVSDFLKAQTSEQIKTFLGKIPCALNKRCMVPTPVLTL